MDKAEFLRIILQRGERVTVGGKTFVLPRNNSVPKRLFAYKRVNENLFRLLSDKQIYHGGKDSFNDPDDGINRYRLVFAEDDIKGFLEKLGLNEERRATSHRQLVEYSRDKPEDFERLFKANFMKDIEEFGIACFTTKPDNVLMWGHYADSNKGVCLEFDFSKERELFRSGQLHPADSYMFCMRKVEYSEQMPVVELKHVMEERFTPVYHKTLHWEYEDEYRSIRPTVGGAPFHPACLQGVYLGLRTPDSDIETIRKLLEEHGFGDVPVKQVRRRAGGNGIEVR